MRNKIIVGIVLIVFLLAGPVIAQDKKVKVPKLTLEQKWKSAEGNLTLLFIASLEYAKAQGKSPFHYGNYIGEYFSVGWEGVEGIKAFIEAMHGNWQQWENFQIEVLEESENFYKAKIKGIGEEYLKSWPNVGITFEDYCDGWEGLMKGITKSLGLEYKQNIEGDWIVFSISENK